MPSISTQHSSSRESSPYNPAITRYQSDESEFMGFDMSTTAPSLDQNQDTIDLTLDDDDSPPPHIQSAYQPQHTTSTNSQVTQNLSNYMVSRAPPFGSYGGNHRLSVIDLSSDEEEDTTTSRQSNRNARIAPSSPEVEFVGERVLPPPTTGTNSTFHRRSHLPNFPPLGHFGNLANLYDLTHDMIARFRGARELPEEALNRIDGIFDHTNLIGDGLEQPPDVFDEYDNIQMDYGRPAFNMGGNIIPNLQPLPPTRSNEPACKKWGPPREGFTRNYEEDDMLICGLCGDELATGKTDQKQQVWIIKQCGHAYCGDCARGRAFTKPKQSKDPKKAAAKNGNGFRICAVPDCKKPVDSKTKMFQIYL